MNSMKILFAFSPKVKAILDDGTEKELIIIGNKGGHLLVKDYSENSVYELNCPYAGYHNEIKYEVVAVNGQPPSPPAPTKYTVTVTDSATSVSAVSPASKEVEEGENATFTLTYASGKSASDIEVSAGSVAGTTLTVSSVSEDTTVTITDKPSYTVGVTNSSTSVSAVSPESSNVLKGGNATFTLTFAEGKSAADIEVSAGTVEGTTLTVSNVQANATITITDK